MRFLSTMSLGPKDETTLEQSSFVIQTKLNDNVSKFFVRCLTYCVERKNGPVGHREMRETTSVGHLLFRAKSSIVLSHYIPNIFQENDWTAYMFVYFHERMKEKYESEEITSFFTSCKNVLLGVVSWFAEPLLCHHWITLKSKGVLAESLYVVIPCLLHFVFHSKFVDVDTKPFLPQDRPCCRTLSLVISIAAQSAWIS